MAQEIERKFLLGSHYPWKNQVRGTAQRQGYLKVEHDEEIRIRREGRKATLTMKSGSGIARRELEVSLSLKDFERLWPETEGQRVEKIRYRGKRVSHTWEVDVYQGALVGLRTIEVEFDKLDTARLFKPDVWIGPELTWDPRYKNASLARGQNNVLLVLSEVAQPEEFVIGVIPYIREKNTFSLVTVSTLRGDRFIVPKGQPQVGATREAVALNEAEEEAGIHGKLVGHPLLLPYEKNSKVQNLWLQPMEVSSMKNRWKESSVRKRVIVPGREALLMNDNFLVSTSAKIIQALYA